MTYSEVQKNNIELRGEAWHLLKCAEECSELADAIIKTFTKKSSIEDVKMEIADLELALEFMRKILGDEHINVYKSEKRDRIHEATRELMIEMRR